MPPRQKLELTWIGKDQRPRLEPRILLEDTAHSYHAAHRVGPADSFDNRLIFGDNLLALKALEAEFTGQVKCVYIDPPFNTEQAFELYDDSVEHSTWLTLMRHRIVLLHALLSSDGTLFIHIDDNELGYLIALCDEVFDRKNRISIITFKQGAATGHKAINPGVVSTSNFILMYAKDKSKWRPNRVFTAREERDSRYAQFILNREAPHDKWRFTTLLQAFAAHMRMPERGLKKLLGNDYERLLYTFVLENADSVIQPVRPDYNAVSEAARGLIDTSVANPNEVLHLKREGYSDMYFKNGQRILFYSGKLKLVDGKYVAAEPLTSIWDDLLSNNLHKEGGIEFPKGKKPEALIKRCLEIATQPGDLVLDSFAGSGTTGAVAHKMRRRWIMVELGQHCHSHVIPRLRKVIDGQDPNGVTAATSWEGGGGYRYFHIAPSLLTQDHWGRLVVNKAYNPAMLAEAVCKLEGFAYAPSSERFWEHGHSSERDFLYVTTQTLTEEQLRHLAEELGPDRTLLVCCAAWRGSATDFPTLTLKKLPQAVLHRCEWGHDDYSLNVANLTEKPAAPVASAMAGLPLFEAQPVK